MLTIKFRRVGKRHQPTYRLVVSERGSKLQGRHREDLGWYHPHLKTSGLKDDRIKYWLSVGAKPTSTIHNLLINKGLIDGKKIAVHSQSKKEPVVEAPAETVETPAAEATKGEAPVESAPEVVEATPQVKEGAPVESAPEVKEEVPAEGAEPEVKTEEPASNEVAEGKPAEEPKE
ncbi:MAG: 30S ribosomal protein S16 [Candidatus Harrisonbacteria bacterium CG10_big_fil_rev_8_21_14_0_10_44_23]|uniref:Small ribosomal subunit protein bS16 n=1 Tax=Candidatus Harrisonbacteria bacterium CG10_big_fil_rev_8_21_14_0_10_44_23 TaxID=1974585 RepID=A0A2H0UPT2_9BACT|nr:MAG: 30S ribosomal protein S16 [Candidatus Harrisonbacteria bacterium CG10_big_fil_rev_8_21_14_0_10_44_23]